MQYRYTLPVKKEVLRRLEGLFRFLVFAGILVYLIVHLQDQFLSWQRWQGHSMVRHPYFWLACALMPLNLMLEGWRWQYIVSLETPISFGSAQKGVLAGLAFGLITPHAAGDYFGRLLSAPVRQPERFAGSLLLSRVALLMWTITFGSLGAGYMFGWPAAALCLLAGPAVLLLTYLVARNSQFPGRRYLEPFLDGLKLVGTRALATISLLGLARYLVFSLQFFLLLSIVLPFSSLTLLAGVTWIFLAKSVLPSINFLSDLGVREFSAVVFFSSLTGDTLLVVLASLILWCINIALPALAGGFILLKERRT